MIIYFIAIIPLFLFLVGAKCKMGQISNGFRSLDYVKMLPFDRMLFRALSFTVASRFIVLKYENSI